MRVYVRFMYLDVYSCYVYFHVFYYLYLYVSVAQCDVNAS